MCNKRLVFLFIAALDAFILAASTIEIAQYSDRDFCRKDSSDGAFCPFWRFCLSTAVYAGVSLVLTLFQYRKARSCLDIPIFFFQFLASAGLAVTLVLIQKDPEFEYEIWFPGIYLAAKILISIMVGIVRSQ